MAQRRMIAKTIIESDAFLDMPASARLLYYDLNIRADDDGFVNSPKKVMRETGASSDDLKILIGKKFIIPFESGIVVIKHWKIHNYIRADRYKETNYKNEKSILLLDENGAYTQNPKFEQCIPDVNQVVDKRDTQDRLGKDRLGKDRLDILVPYETICERFNSICKSLSKVVSITDKRKTKIKARWNELKTIEAFENLFYLTEQSDFLCGREKDWKCSFDWLVDNNTNYIKVLEGQYNNKIKTVTEDPYEKLMREAMQDEYARNDNGVENHKYILPETDG